MNNNFYEEQEFKYTEVATVLSKDDGKVKLFLNTITPELSSGKAKKKKKSKGSVKKILNKSVKSNIKAVTVANYVTVPEPEHIKVNKGDEVLVAFTGGELRYPRIIGMY